MCKECRHYPCHPSCPFNSDPEPEVVHLCWNCGAPIYEDEPVYEINGEHWCQRCGADPWLDNINKGE